MDIKELYSIGRISKICDISIQTLRYYDKMGILKPNIINEENNYRYYSHKQILHIKIIQQLRELDFSLAEIKRFIQREDSSVILRLLVQKKVEIKNKITSLMKIEDKLAAHIKNIQLIDQSDSMPYIELKNLPPRVVAFTRYHSPCNPDAFSVRYNELQETVKKNNWNVKGNLMAIYYDHYSVFDYNNADIEVCVQIDKPTQCSDFIRTIPGGQYMTALHKGPYDTHPKSYILMMEWLEENRYEINGPSLERYIIDMFYTNNPENFITELQFPVKKVLTL